MGLLLALLSAGGGVAESWLGARRGRKLALGGAILLSTAVAALITLPLVPVSDVHATPIPAINADVIETVGWPTLAATVSRVWNELPQSERSTAVVYTSNYGEAGALARYGPADGIARAYSGHNAFWRFGRPPNGARPIIVVGYHHPQALRGNFSGCGRSARIDNGVALDRAIKDERLFAVRDDDPDDAQHRSRPSGSEPLSLLIDATRRGRPLRAMSGESTLAQPSVMFRAPLSCTRVG